MYAQHHRFQIWNQNQHPFKHQPSEFLYQNPSLPPGSVTTLQGAIDWLFAVVYPQSKAAVANVAALPAVGNTLNDYRVVQDDGDGKAAGYRWEQREGEATPSWHKILDVDWGTDSVLQAWQARTQYLFMMKYGYDDLDNTGTALTGNDAGQHLYGGFSAGTHLTLHANAGDGAGAQTGYIQLVDQVRPTTDNVVSLGTAALNFKDLFLKGNAKIGTMTIASGSITDSSGAISFDNENLTTSGFIVAGTAKVMSGSITDSSGAISFNDENLSTTGTLAAGATTVTGLLTASQVVATGTASQFKTGTTIGNLTLADGSITAGGGAISFGSNNISTTGSVGGGTGVFTTSVSGGNVTVSNNLVASSSGQLNLQGNNGTVQCISGSFVASAMAAVSLTTGVTVITSQSISTGATALTITCSTLTLAVSNVSPSANNVVDLGAASLRFKDIYMLGSISDGTNSISSSTLQSLRDINVGVAAGMTIFWSGTQWLPSLPDTEVTHSGLSGLTTGDAGHTQFVMLAGRAGSQTVNGGTASGENLTLDSTAHVTKGNIIVASVVKPSGDNTLDLGTSGAQFKDFYLAGQAIGLRIENYTTVGRPAASAGKKGRLYYDTTTDDVFVDRGGAWNKLSIERSQTVDTTGWDGSQTQISYDVSADFTDARKGVWQLQKNSDNNKVVLCDIDFPDATHVRVTVDIPLAAGTYTLVGVG